MGLMTRARSSFMMSWWYQLERVNGCVDSVSVMDGFWIERFFLVCEFTFWKEVLGTPGF